MKHLLSAILVATVGLFIGLGIAYADTPPPAPTSSTSSLVCPEGTTTPDNMAVAIIASAGQVTVIGNLEPSDPLVADLTKDTESLKTDYHIDNLAGYIEVNIAGKALYAIPYDKTGCISDYGHLLKLLSEIEAN